MRSQREPCVLLGKADQPPHFGGRALEHQMDVLATYGHCTHNEFHCAKSLHDSAQHNLSLTFGEPLGGAAQHTLALRVPFLIHTGRGR